MGRKGKEMTEEQFNELVEKVDSHAEMLSGINNILQGSLTTFGNLKDMIENIYKRVQALEDAVTEVK